MPALQQTAGWITVVFMAVVFLIILLKMALGKIDLKYLISEENGQASLSRFQFLVFTFVIAMGLVVIILEKGAFPNIGSDVFGLLGISGGSYVASKITQKAAGLNGNSNPPAGG